jgi:hypothetical protein
MGWGFFEDIVDAATDVVEDVGSSIGEAVGDIGEAVVETVSDVGEAAWDAGSWFAGGAVDVLGNAGGVLGHAIGAAADAVDTATGGLAGHAMNALDDYVFDTVDYVTGGTIDVDFDDGALSVGLGIDGIASIDASVGERGISYGTSAAGAGGSVALTDEGFAADYTAGVNFGPLPYLDGHIDISPEGDISVQGEIQGTIPTPIGLLSGEVKGGFANTSEGWGAFVDGDGTLYLPEGTTVSGGLEASYLETADGTFASVGVEGSVSNPAYGSAGGAVGYTHMDSGGVEIDTVHAEGYAQGFGTQISGEVDYAHAETPEGEFSSLSGDVDVDGPGGLWAEDAPAVGVPGTAQGAVPGAPAGDAPAAAASRPVGPNDAPPEDVDVLGTAPAPVAGAGVEPMEVVSAVGAPAAVEGPAATAAPAPVVADVAPEAAPPVDEVLVEAPPAPADDFTVQVQAADQVEESLDDLFEGLQ